MSANLKKVKVEAEVDEIIKQAENLLNTVENYQNIGSTTPSKPLVIKSGDEKYQNFLEITNKEKIKEIVSSGKGVFAYSYSAKKIVLFRDKINWNALSDAEINIKGELLKKLNELWLIANPQNPTYLKDGYGIGSNEELTFNYENNELIIAFKLIKFVGPNNYDVTDTSIYIAKFKLN
ncbi:hypothetical protein NPA07_00250 [Mycoplasmopsis caviae]|uniref:Uncharacterized protein n=1 Tax=Mycoplasmopsis caviae TaxID=55603 RepID=A0A3P8KBG1_9BACT|nr:hypothetical protein [Mycoplasmopsis caviae]UUD35299.1 hypothetical protein NPA07_00250 [Mycoplasmopsis caviae]VDR41924.1 Uncharacterised protein [Mycoplasmopsis caviae]